MIDPGHGGHDTGTIGPNGLEEKDLVLEVGRRLGKLLETRLGAEVVYTRKDDTFIPLETRTAIANQARADLFVSIHANSSHDAAARGVETYYLNFTSSPEALEVAARENAVSEQSIYQLQDLVKKIALKEKIEESREFAWDVQQSLHSGLAVMSPAIRDRGVKKAPFIVLIGANMPSILAEISFVSNPTDEHRLATSEYRQRIAESLYRGVAKYVNGLSGVNSGQQDGKNRSAVGSTNILRATSRPLRSMVWHRRKLFPLLCGLIREGNFVPSRLSKLSSKFLKILLSRNSCPDIRLRREPRSDSAAPILPKQFAGWQLEATPQASKDAAAADPTNAALLKEYGFSDVESATYKSDDGRTLKIRAARFADASGAFGAYMFYVQPEMAREEIGDQGASLTQRVLFYRRTYSRRCRIQANFQSCRRRTCVSWPAYFHIPMEMPEAFLQFSLSCRITVISRILRNMRRDRLGLPPLRLRCQRNWSTSAPVLKLFSARYSTPGGDATLMLIEYPTPALAAEHLRRIDAAHHAAQPQPGVTAVENVGPFFDKRTEADRRYRRRSALAERRARRFSAR